MDIKNFEFKARVDQFERFEEKLLKLNPEFKGIDHQIDTYFNVPHGRLKLREGNIENALIQYDRENIAGAKAAQIILYKHTPNEALKSILIKQFGIKTIVEKCRKIYFIDNVKFHFDNVSQLGEFIEVEAIDDNNLKSLETLKAQCDLYATYFGLKPEDFIDISYSDMLISIQRLSK